MAKPKVRIGRVDATNGPFTGVQIELENGERITFQLHGAEGWVQGDVEIIPDAGDVGVGVQGTGHRFDII